jgi:AcrR family transcriptional regulator
MQRGEKSERSRRAVLDSALHLFSHQGFRGTTMREIADRAGVSTGNVYHHFPDKDAVFLELVQEYSKLVDSPRFPFTKMLKEAMLFPDNIEELGFAARDSVRQFRAYFAIVYVDMIEFGGGHIRQLYADMADRFSRAFEEAGAATAVQKRLRPNVTPTAALLLTSRLFFSYFMLEILFGVEAPFGKSSNEAVQEIADIVRNGICAR